MIVDVIRKIYLHVILTAVLLLHQSMDCIAATVGTNCHISASGYYENTGIYHFCRSKEDFTIYPIIDESQFGQCGSSFMVDYSTSPNGFEPSSPDHLARYSELNFSLLNGEHTLHHDVFGTEGTTIDKTMTIYVRISAVDSDGNICENEVVSMDICDKYVTEPTEASIEPFCEGKMSTLNQLQFLTYTTDEFHWYNYPDGDWISVYPEFMKLQNAPAGVYNYMLSRKKDGCRSFKIKFPIYILGDIKPTVNAPFIRYTYEDIANGVFTKNLNQKAQESIGTNVVSLLVDSKCKEVWYDKNGNKVESVDDLTPQVPDTPGNSFFTVSVSQDCGCGESDKINVTVIVYRPPQVTVKDVEFCINDPRADDGTKAEIGLIGDGSDNKDSYVLRVSRNKSMTDAVSLAPGEEIFSMEDLGIDISVPGKYTFYVRQDAVTGEQSEPVEMKVSVVDVQKPKLYKISDNICLNNSNVINLIGYTGDRNLVWEENNKTMPSTFLTDLEAGVRHFFVSQYYNIKDSDGTLLGRCLSEKEELTITFNSLTTSFESVPSACPGEEFVYRVTAESDADITYRWHIEPETSIVGGGGSTDNFVSMIAQSDETIVDVDVKAGSCIFSYYDVTKKGKGRVNGYVTVKQPSIERTNTFDPARGHFVFYSCAEDAVATFDLKTTSNEYELKCPDGSVRNGLFVNGTMSESVSDIGNYKLTYRNECDTEITFSVEEMTFDVSEVHNSFDVCEGEEVTVLLSGVDECIIFWKKNDETTGKAGKQFEIEKVSMSDAGVYSCSIIKNGCVESFEINNGNPLVVHPNPVFDTNIQTSYEVIRGKNVMLNAITEPENENSSIKWYNGELIGTGKSVLINNVTKDERIKVVAEENGCKSEMYIDVLVDCEPQVIISADVTEICGTGTVTLTVDTSRTGHILNPNLYSIRLYDLNGILHPLTFRNGILETVISNLSFSDLFTVMVEYNGVKAEDNVYVTVNPLPVFTTETEIRYEVTKGGNVTLSAQTEETSSIKWYKYNDKSLIGTGENLTLNNIAKDEKLTVVAESDGCQAQKEINVLVDSKIKVRLSSDKSMVCGSGSVVLSVDTSGTGKLLNPESYSLKLFDGNNTELPLTYRSSTSMICNVSDLNESTTFTVKAVYGDLDYEDKLTVTVNPIPVFDSDVKTRYDVEKGGDVILTAQTTSDSSVETIIRWENNGLIGTGESVTLSNITSNEQLTVTAIENGCQADMIVNIVVDSKSKVSISLDKYSTCEGNSVTVTVDTSGTGYIINPSLYSVSLANKKGEILPLSYKTKSSLTSVITGLKEDDTYTVKVSYKGTEITDSVSVSVYPKSEIKYDLSSSEVCGGDEVSVYLNPEPLNDLVSFTWNYDVSLQSSLSSQNMTIKPEYNGGGNIQVQTFVVSMNIGDCPAVREEIEIKVHRPLNGSIRTEDILCSGDSVKLDATSFGADNYIWSSDIWDEEMTGPVVTTTQKSVSQTYYLRTTRGECETVKNVVVKSGSLPNILSIDSVGLREVNIVLDNPNGVYSYIIDEKTDADDIESAYKTKLRYGTHSLRVIDQAGCYTDTTFVINTPELEFQTVFTPNGDGVNDYFVIPPIYQAYENTEMKIYDRFGKVICTLSAGDENEGWDGSYNGQPMPSTDYWYELLVHELRLYYTGHFTLIRGK